MTIPSTNLGFSLTSSVCSGSVVFIFIIYLGLCDSCKGNDEDEDSYDSFHGLKTKKSSNEDLISHLFLALIFCYHDI